jgi:hypothetical protein
VDAEITIQSEADVEPDRTLPPSTGYWRIMVGRRDLPPRRCPRAKIERQAVRTDPLRTVNSPENGLQERRPFSPADC